MKRSSFIKALFGLAVAPQIIGEIEFVSPPIAPIATKNSLLISQLNLLLPEYYKQLIEKYGSENYSLVMEVMGKQPPTTHGQFRHFENELK